MPSWLTDVELHHSGRARRTPRDAWDCQGPPSSPPRPNRSGADGHCHCHRGGNEPTIPRTAISWHLTPRVDGVHLFFEQLSPSSQLCQAVGSRRDQVRLLPRLIVGEEAGRRVAMPSFAHLAASFILYSYSVIPKFF